MYQHVICTWLIILTVRYSGNTIAKHAHFEDETLKKLKVSYKKPGFTNPPVNIPHCEWQ